MADKKKKQPKEEPVSLSGPDFKELMKAFLEVESEEGMMDGYEIKLVTALKKPKDEQFSHVTDEGKRVLGKMLSEHLLDLGKDGWGVIHETHSGADDEVPDEVAVVALARRKD